MAWKYWLCSFTLTKYKISLDNGALSFEPPPPHAQIHIFII